MTIGTVVMFRANDGSTHESEDAAKQRNGVLALVAFIKEKWGEEAMFNVLDVVKYHMDWTNVYLSGAK